jgi:hypothetical protein
VQQQQRVADPAFDHIQLGIADIDQPAGFAVHPLFLGYGRSERLQRRRMIADPRMDPQPDNRAWPNAGDCP